MGRSSGRGKTAVAPSRPRSLCLALLLSIVAACEGPAGPLDIRHVLGLTSAELKGRWGEPDIEIRKSEQLSTLQWKEIDGTWVYVVCQDDRACYVTYTFTSMEPFDELEAFRRIGLPPPDGEQPEHVWENGARRWMPFREYHRLTVNPDTKTISVSQESTADSLGKAAAKPATSGTEE